MHLDHLYRNMLFLSIQHKIMEKEIATKMGKTTISFTIFYYYLNIHDYVNSFQMTLKIFPVCYKGGATHLLGIRNPPHSRPPINDTQRVVLAAFIKITCQLGVSGLMATNPLPFY